MAIDPRAYSETQLTAPAPLPFVSRRALKRVKDPAPMPVTCKCGGRVELVENSEIYNGRSYGDWPYAYLCRGCKAYVGLHPQTDIPLGTPADKETRVARQNCKQVFEPIWRNKVMSRTKAYAWLAKRLGIDVADCHFGLFDADQCYRAAAACAELSKFSNQPRKGK